MSDYEKKVGISETPNRDTEEDEVKDWQRTIASTETWRDGMATKSGWKRYIDEYKNEWGELAKSVSIPLIPINLIYAYTKTEIARLYFKDPWITVNPKRVEDIGAAQIAEQIVNYTWMDLSLKSETKRTILEAILVGHSYVKVGYAATFGTVESQPKDVVPAKRGPGRPPKDKVAEVETSEYIKSENVFAYHVPYTDVLFDPSATFPAPHNARWMAHKIVKPLRAVKESGIYDHVEDLKSSSFRDDPNMPYSTSGSTKEQIGKEVKTVTLYEIYDLDHMEVITVSPGCPYFLSRIKYPDWLAGGFPFVQLAFNPVPGEVWPMSDVAAQEGLSIEMTKIVAIWVNHLKRWNRQVFMKTDLLTEAEKSKFKDSIDGAIIEVQGMTGDISQGLHIPQYPPVAADSYQIYNECYKLYQIISGQTPADQGGQAKVPTRTLGELRMQMSGGHARADEKVDVLEDFLGEIAKKMLTIMQKKYDLTKISRIVGPKAVQKKIMGVLPNRPSAQPTQPGGAPNPSKPQNFQSDFAFSWNKDDIMGEMDVDIVAGSTVPMDRESQLQILEKLMPLLPAAGITPGSPGAKAYAREVLRLVGIQSVEAIMDMVDENPQPPPPNPKMQEIQAKVQAKQQETQQKIQAKQQESQIKLQSLKSEEQIKLQSMQADMAHQQKKHQMDTHKNIINSLLQGVRGQPQETGNGNG